VKKKTTAGRQREEKRNKLKEKKKIRVKLNNVARQIQAYFVAQPIHARLHACHIRIELLFCFFQ
jgi:hypothetical protein